MGLLINERFSNPSLSGQRLVNADLHHSEQQLRSQSLTNKSLPLVTLLAAAHPPTRRVPPFPRMPHTPTALRILKHHRKAATRTVSPKLDLVTVNVPLSRNSAQHNLRRKRSTLKRWLKLMSFGRFLIISRKSITKGGERH